MSEADCPPAAVFRLVVVPGVVVDRWLRAWGERQPQVRLEIVAAAAGDAAGMLPGGADAGLVRLPVDRGRLHAIPLYTETSVVVFPRDHVLGAAESVTLDEVVSLGEPMLRPGDDVLDWGGDGGAAGEQPATTAEAVEWVAASAGLLVVPQSLARLYHRKDLRYRTVSDAPASGVGLAWPVDGHTALVEEMIGIVRGRTVNSTRGQAPAKGPAAGPAAGKGRTTGASPGRGRAPGAAGKSRRRGR